MKWDKSKIDNSDVVDQRGGGGRRASAPAVGGGVGVVGIIVALLVTVLGGGGSNGSGFNIPNILNQLPAAAPATPGTAIPASQDPDKDLRDFSAYVFTDVQKYWEKTLTSAGKPYKHAKLVLYRDAVSTGCGNATSAVGPFYCPADQRVYLDLSFYDQMRKELGASGDFAWAYVIAHEMGHHVQEETGTEAAVTKQREDDPSQANPLSVRLELQADCYAGVWGHTVYAEGDLQKGDIDEAFNAAEAVGDDRLQKRATGTIHPDTFTHGTSAQRKKWFDTGYESGDASQCDTFSPDSP